MPRVMYVAPVVCPMDRPPIAAGGVLCAGDRVLAVDTAASLRAEAERVVEVAGVILPGLVNAHTHLELTAADHLAVEGPFHQWLRALLAAARGWTTEDWTRSAHRGVLQSLRAGTTAVFDVVRRGPAVPAAARAGLAGDSWVEAAMVDVEHHDSVLAGIASALDLPADGRRVGIAAQAVYTLGTGVFQALAALARERRVPLHLHAAECRAEVLAIEEGRGPLAELGTAGGYEFEWLDGGSGLGPVDYLDACGALFEGASIAHGVWVDEADVALLGARGVAVVCCPRSNALLHAGEAPLERYAVAGTPLALGTESRASAPDLDVLGEAAAWVALARARGLSAWPSADGPRSLEEQAVRLATVEGAQAMGWGERCGVLAPGRRADLVGVAIESSADGVFADVAERGAGRQVLTVVAGVRRSRRDDPDRPWPEIDDSWREEAS